MSSRFVLSAQLNINPPSPQSIRGVINSVNQQLRGIKTPQILNGAQVQQQAQRAAKGLNSTAAAAKNLNRQAARTGSIFQDLQKRFRSRLIDASIFSVVNSAIVGIGSAFVGSIRSAVAFEKELTKVAQVTNQTIGELDGLVKTVGDVSIAFGTSSAELISVSRTLAQAGLSAADTEVALRSIAATDLAPTFENMGKTAEGAIAIFGQFGTGVGELGDQLGSINAIAGSFAVESGDLIEAIKRGGSAFQTAGGTLNEYLSIFTAVRSTTREGAAQIATGLRTIFTRIQRPQTIEYFRNLGVELTDVTGKFIGGFEAARRLSEAFGNLEQGDTQLIEVAQQLGGVRQVTRVLPILQKFGKAENALKVAAEGTNSVLEDREVALGTFAVQFGQLTESVKEFGRTLLDEAKVLQGLLTILKTTTQVASDFLKASTSLADTIGGEGTLSFIGFGAAIFGASRYLGGFSFQISALAAAAATLTPILAGMFTTGESDAQKFNAELTKTAVIIGGIAATIKTFGGFSALGSLGSQGLFANPFAGSNAANLQARAGGFTPGLGVSAASGAETGIDALGGAAVGAGSALLFQTLFGETRKNIEIFNKALKDGTSAQQASAAVTLQASEDLDAAGLAISGGVGAVAGAFLGPIAGQLAGALTGLVTSILFTTDAFQAFAGLVRDGLARITGGFVQSTARIAELARIYGDSNAVIKATTESMKKFKERMDGLDGSEDGASREDFVRTFSGTYAKIEKLRADRANASEGLARGNLEEGGERAKLYDKTTEAIDKEEKAFIEGFKSVSREAVAAGQTFDELFYSLPQAIQDAISDGGNWTYVNQLRRDFEELQGVIGGRLTNQFRDSLQRLVDLQRKSADSFRNFLSVQDEASQIIQEFGGSVYTASQREANLVQQANAGASLSGVSNIDNISAGSISNRAGEIGKELAETRRQLELAGGDSEEGGRLEVREKELIRLSKQTYDITKQGIDIRKKELEIIKQRNSAEESALNAAIAGDFQKLFSQQAAGGAIASAASGGGAAGFGQKAIADAIAQLQQQRSSGVSSVFGADITSVIRELTGTGLSNIGINDSRSADIAAGGSAEEELLKKQIRELASVLPEASKAEVLAADTQMEAARINLQVAQAAADRANIDVSGITHRASGGSIWRRRGTDSVPSMLTPGEFVVKRSAVQRGNNLNMLRAMNGGGTPQSIGGTVYASSGGHYSGGGSGGIDFSAVSRAAKSMESASKSMSEMVNKLGSLKLNVTLAPTNHNVNITGTAALQAMGESIKEEVIEFVGLQLQNSKASDGGKLDTQPTQSNLPSIFN